MIPNSELAVRRRLQGGHGIVEFALSVTIFFTLVLGSMNLAYGVYCYHTIAYAARDAVRYAIVRASSPTAVADVTKFAIKSAVGVKLTATNVTVTFPYDVAIPLQQDAKVAISYPYKLMLTPVAVNLTSTSQMLVSQ